MSEFDVLKALSESGGEMEWSALMNTDKSVQETSGSLQLLLHSGYISGSLAPYSSVKITPIGRAYYSKLSEEHDEKRREQNYIREENAKWNTMLLSTNGYPLHRCSSLADLFCWGY